MSMHSTMIANLFGRVTPVTPSDVTPQGRLIALYVAATGNAVVQGINPDGSLTGTDITLTGLPVGVLIPFAIGWVKSTGTTATLLSLA